MRTPREYLEHLRASDEATRKRATIAASAVATALLLVVWVFYLGNTLPPVGGAKAAEGGIAAETGHSVLGTIAAGAREVGARIKRQFSSAADELHNGYGKVSDMRDGAKQGGDGIPAEVRAMMDGAASSTAGTNN